jgi:septum formation protein
LRVLRFECLKPDLNEEEAKNELIQKKISPWQLARELARLKAESLKYLKNALIIGGDQLIHLNGQIFGKPGNRDKAIEQLTALHGKTHELVTATYVITPEKNYEFLDRIQMTMKDLKQEEIENYVDRDLPFNCAGSYMIEKNGRSLFSEIKTEDFTIIEGLPLITLRDLLHNLGYETEKTDK